MQSLVIGLWIGGPHLVQVHAFPEPPASHFPTRFILLEIRILSLISRDVITGTSHSRQVAIHGNIFHRKIMLSYYTYLRIHNLGVVRISILQRQAIIMVNEFLLVCTSTFPSQQIDGSGKKPRKRRTYRTIRNIMSE